LALIAFANARDIYSTSESKAGCELTEDEERNLPGVGILLDFPGVGIPDTLGFPGVADILSLHGTHVLNIHEQP
jgi:hypothetical protein